MNKRLDNFDSLTGLFKKPFNKWSKKELQMVLRMANQEIKEWERVKAEAIEMRLL